MRVLNQIDTSSSSVRDACPLAHRTCSTAMTLSCGNGGGAGAAGLRGAREARTGIEKTTGAEATDPLAAPSVAGL